MSFLGSSLEVHEIKMRLVSVAVFLPSCFFFSAVWVQRQLAEHWI